MLDLPPLWRPDHIYAGAAAVPLHGRDAEVNLG